MSASATDKLAAVGVLHGAHVSSDVTRANIREIYGAKFIDNKSRFGSWHSSCFSSPCPSTPALRYRVRADYAREGLQLGACLTTEYADSQGTLQEV